MTAAVTNWKNVNNWHWTGKNCTPWAKNFFSKALVDISAETKSPTGATINVKTTSLVDFKGDCDLNQRKGKIITIFDLEMGLKWSGENDRGTKTSGKISIPEFMHDTEADEIPFEVTMEGSEDEDKSHIKKAVKESLLPELTKRMMTFAKELVDAHAEDVYIAPEKMNGHPVTAPYQP
ncbi:hypothetical protein HK102_007747, partial [Quaeritorhiza haematococci]